MRLFIYGTLLGPGVFGRRGGRMPARSLPASLPGWRRVALRNSPYPTLRRDRLATTQGLVVNIGADTARRLAIYEGAKYRLKRVVVQTAKGKTAAWTWIANGATTHEWKD